VCQLTIPKGRGFEIFAIYPPLPIIRHVYVVAGQNLDQNICQLSVFANIRLPIVCKLYRQNMGL
jgi:hypothetical protein